MHSAPEAASATEKRCQECRRPKTQIAGRGRVTPVHSARRIGGYEVQSTGSMHIVIPTSHRLVAYLPSTADAGEHRALTDPLEVMNFQPERIGTAGHGAAVAVPPQDLSALGFAGDSGFWVDDFDL